MIGGTRARFYVNADGFTHSCPTDTYILLRSKLSGPFPSAKRYYRPAGWGGPGVQTTLSLLDFHIIQAWGNQMTTTFLAANRLFPTLLFLLFMVAFPRRTWTLHPIHRASTHSAHRYCENYKREGSPPHIPLARTRDYLQMLLMKKKNCMMPMDHSGIEAGHWTMIPKFAAKLTVFSTTSVLGD